MASYHYQAFDKNGKNLTGYIEAETEYQARQALKAKTLIPVKVYQAVREKYTKLKSSSLSLIMRQLATLINASIPLEEALKSIIEQSRDKKIKALLIAIRTKVLEGYSFAQTLEFYSFSSLITATIKAGEKSGKLDRVLERLADYNENQFLIAQKIKQALIYPIIMIIISFAIVGFLLSFVVPKIIEVFVSSNQALPFFTILLMYISSLFQKYWLYTIIFLILSVTVFKYCLRFASFKNLLHKLVLKVLFIKYIIITINIAKYTHTFSILCDSGVNIIENMQIAAETINNSTIKNKLIIASKLVKEGVPINLALQKSSYFNPMSIYLIASGEKTNSLGVMMYRSAAYLDNEINRLIDTFLKLLEPLIILIMGVIVLFIVLATLLPIFSMEQLVL